MYIFKIYDNGGQSWDRFTVLIEPYSAGECNALGLSENCDSPQGFSQWGDAMNGAHLGHEINFDDLPANVQQHVLTRLGF